MSLSVDEATGRVRAAFVRVREGTAFATREVAAGRVFADYSEDGVLVAVELLAPCTAEELEELSADEPEHVKRFLRGSQPRELVAGGESEPTKPPRR
jgi:hypothetical protein